MLFRSLEKEKELNDLKSRFISNASHEFRTPLASILLICDVLKQYWKQLDPEQIDTRIGKITDQAAHLSQIVNKVFEISKFREGITGFYPGKVDLVVLCNTIVDGFNQHEATKKRITFYSSVESMVFNLDQRLIIQSLNNIISNALKYSPEDSFIQIKLSENRKEVQLQVKDSGIGISSEDQKHLFQPFFRGGNIGNIPGNGMGLSIAKESIQMHGGNIKVCSKLNRNTTFIICLPKKINTSDN